MMRFTFFRSADESVVVVSRIKPDEILWRVKDHHRRRGLFRFQDLRSKYLR